MKWDAHNERGDKKNKKIYILKIKKNIGSILKL
jgi:hypothetical protein